MKVKLVFEDELNGDNGVDTPMHVFKIELDLGMSLAECTEVATAKAVKKGVLPKATVIRLAIADAVGDKSLVESGREMRAYLETFKQAGSVSRMFKQAGSGACLYAWVQPEPLDVKLVFEAPINRILKIKLDIDMSLAECTEVATTEAVKAGVLPKATVIRLAVTDAEGDKCLVSRGREMRAYLQAFKQAGNIARIYAWPEFTSMPSAMS
jgi:hypothetical protein